MGKSTLLPCRYVRTFIYMNVSVHLLVYTLTFVFTCEHVRAVCKVYMCIYACNVIYELPFM
jgi:hypothetical protein